MPRSKGSEPRHHVTPTRIQDGTGLENGIYITIIETFVAPILERLEIVEAALEELQGLAGFSLATAEVRLRKGGQGGTTYIEPALLFDEASIGSPVLITQAPS